MGYGGAWKVVNGWGLLVKGSGYGGKTGPGEKLGIGGFEFVWDKKGGEVKEGGGWGLFEVKVNFAYILII